MSKREEYLKDGTRRLYNALGKEIKSIIKAYMKAKYGDQGKKK